MHGLGNDFIIFDNIKDLNIHESKFIKKRSVYVVVDDTKTNRIPRYIG